MLETLAIVFMLLTFILVLIDIFFIPTAILSVVSIVSYLSFLLYIYLEVGQAKAILFLVIFLILGGGLAYAALRYKWWQILSHTPALERDETQYDSLAELKGRSARAISDLRPAGKVMVGNKRYDAVAQASTYIEEGVVVTITGTNGSQLIVKTLS